LPSDTLTTSHSVSTAQGGVTRDRLPSNICHRGNREDKLHLIHTRRIVTLTFPSRRDGGPGRRLMSVQYGRQGPSGCTQLHCLTRRGYCRCLTVQWPDMMAFNVTCSLKCA
jgi:hypothetical protein